MFIDKVVRVQLRHDFKESTDGLKEINVLGHPMYIIGKDRGLSQELLTYGIHEPFLTLLLFNEVREDDVIVALGANIGYYVLLFCGLIKNNGKVIAIEPDNRSFPILKKNLDLNGYSSLVKVQNVGVGPQKTVAYFSQKCSFNLSRICSSFDKIQAEEGVRKINLLTLDDILGDEAKIDIITMDIEGYEFKVIDGMIKTLKNLQPRLLIVELHPTNDFQSIDSFFEILEGFNYRIAWVSSRHLIDGMLDAPIPLLKVVLELINGKTPQTKFKMLRDVIEPTTFSKKFQQNKEIVHIVFSKKK
jgi:FkbM family methyltransferase